MKAGILVTVKPRDLGILIKLRDLCVLWKHKVLIKTVLTEREEKQILCLFVATLNTLASAFQGDSFKRNQSMQKC